MCHRSDVIMYLFSDTSYETCVGKYWNITAFDSINVCNCPILFYYTSDLRVKVYATSGSIIPAVASRACNKLAEKYIQRNYTRVTFLVLYINRISMSFCLFICLFVCLFVLKLLLGKWISIVEWYIAGCALFRGPMLSIFEPDMITW